jgi:non-specific serine/threonine protein kinase
MVWYQRLEREHDNVRAALAWSRSAPRRSRAGLQLAGAIWRFWSTRGYRTEGWEQLESLLARKKAERDGPPSAEALRARARAMVGAGWLAARGIVPDKAVARASLSEGLAIYEELGDRWGIANALCSLATIDHFAADVPDLLHRSLAIFRELGDAWGITYALLHQGSAAYWAQQDFPAARRLLEEALWAAREAGDLVFVSGALNTLGLVAEAQRDLEAARMHFGEAVEVTQQVGFTSGNAWALRNLGRVSAALGEFQAAQAFFARAMTVSRDTGDRLGMLVILVLLARMALAQGQAARAAQISAACAALTEAMGFSSHQLLRAEQDENVAAARAAVTEQEFAAAWAEGHSITLEAAVSFALQDIREG